MSLQQSVGFGILRPLRKMGLAAARHWPWAVKANIATGRTIYVDLRSSLGRGIYMKGEFDPNVFAPLHQVLRPGDIFLDIGANIGYYSMLALDLVGPSGQVHAFEVDERPLRCLRKTRRAQRLSNLFIHTVAIGDRTGTANFYQDPDSGHSHLTQNSGARRVAITTLDDWSNQVELPRVRAIKIDIEGAEILALHGARQFIAKHRPVWVCEAWDSTASSPGGAALFLRDLGYRIETLADVDSPIVVAWP